MKKATAMNVTAAIGILGQCKSVDEWNEKRESIKASVTMQDWVENYVPLIDANGLIVRVLGRDGNRYDNNQ
jgi:hypothetical protein